MTAPEGSIVNCKRPAPVSVATVGAIQSVNNAACSTIGKMLAASEKYRDEATAVWHANHFAIFKFGRNQHGREAIGILTETFAGAGGARTFSDGVDVGGEVPNPISRMANVETVENAFPIRYQYRRVHRDSGGAGYFRGGVGMCLAITPHDAPDGGIHYVVSGKGSMFPMSDGLAGGYPGAPNVYLWHRAREGCDKLSEQSVDWGVFPLMGEDTLEVRWNGGGGVGDPLLRPVTSVLRDVREGMVSLEAALEVYGVVIDPESDTADESATGAARSKLLKSRQGATGDVPTNGSLPINLYFKEKNQSIETSCARCNHLLASGGEFWKSGLKPKERDLNKVITTYTTAEAVRLREYYCPKCSVLLESEVFYEDDPPLLDYVGVVPHASG